VRIRPVYFLGIFIPAAVALELAHADPVIVFFAAALGVIPTAALMGEATEHLAARSGPGIGGLLNVTFGNAPELIIALFALNAGLQEVVKASIAGSILGNILLVLGASMLVGGWKREKQTFNATAAHAQAAMLLLALLALILPALYELINGGGLPKVTEEGAEFSQTCGGIGSENCSDLKTMSFIVAIILIGSYAAGLWFSLKTHRSLFNPYTEEESGEHDHEHWSTKRSLISLAIAGALVGVMSEVLVGSISEASESIGISQFFVGIFIVAIVGNAAEHWVAVLVAAKNKMDLAVNIAVGSSAQIALFIAPLLVLASFVIGPEAMPLVFNGYEIGAMIFAVLIANFLTQDGESNWFEGVQLLAVYAVMGVVFFFA
jgi:Ca2+:H+ antiporter